MGKTKIDLHYFKEKITLGDCVILQTDPSSTQRQLSYPSTWYGTQLMPPISLKKIDGTKTRYIVDRRMKRKQGKETSRCCNNPSLDKVYGQSVLLYAIYESLLQQRDYNTMKIRLPGSCLSSPLYRTLHTSYL